MKNIFYQLADEYVNFEIAGKKVRVPYCMAFVASEKPQPYHKSRTNKYKNYGGKGTTQQLRTLLIAKAHKKHFDLERATKEKIALFMEKESIGVDCSGFVYNILDAYLKKEKGVSLDTIILRYPGLPGKIERFLFRFQRVRRCSAATLSNDLNTVTVEKISDIRSGDMLRLTDVTWGRHIAIIVDINQQYITYANASERAKLAGAHFAKIEITNPKAGLEKQKWLEELYDGSNYGKDAFDPKRGDSVRRLKYLL